MMTYVKKFEEMDFNKDAVYTTAYPDTSNGTFMSLVDKYKAVGKLPYKKVGYKIVPVSEPYIEQRGFLGRETAVTIFFLKPELVKTLNDLASNIEEMIELHKKKLDLAIQFTAYTDGKGYKES
jgi:hypothetical protein